MKLVLPCKGKITVIQFFNDNNILLSQSSHSTFLSSRLRGSSHPIIMITDTPPFGAFNNILITCHGMLQVRRFIFIVILLDHQLLMTSKVNTAL